jgi:hypothetical protein
MFVRIRKRKVRARRRKKKRKVSFFFSRLINDCHCCPIERESEKKIDEMREREKEKRIDHNSQVVAGIDQLLV